jgi:hypothetical protein
MLGMKTVSRDRDHLACHREDKRCQAGRLVKNAHLGRDHILADRFRSGESHANVTALSGRWQLLAGGNSDQVAVERNSPVDRRRLISRKQSGCVPSCAHDAVVSPDVFRFAIQKVDRLPRHADTYFSETRSTVLQSFKIFCHRSLGEQGADVGIQRLRSHATRGSFSRKRNGQRRAEPRLPRRNSNSR